MYYKCVKTKETRLVLIVKFSIISWLSRHTVQNYALIGKMTNIPLVYS